MEANPDDQEGFRPRADQPGEQPYYHFITVELGEFAIQSVQDVYAIWQVLANVAIQNPGFVPIMPIEARDGA